MIALLTLAGAGCSEIQTESASPSDPNYQRTGAPRVGEPAIQPNNAYGRIMGGDGHSPL
ncbi:MAG: hypothetical protein WDO24_25740 [Pseudomonadota bacterium]